MYAKLENKTLIPAPHRITLSGMQIFNPTPNQLTQAGYKPVTETPMPDDAPDGQHYDPTYTDTGDTITQVWTLVDDEETETAGKTLEERVTDLEAGQAEITEAIERGLTV